MSRTIINVPIPGDPAAADSLIRNILIADGYREIQYNLEIVWKMGTGLATAMHYIKLNYMGSNLELSGWIQAGIGSVGGKEHSLDGMMAVIPKKSVRKTMNKICEAVAHMEPANRSRIPDQMSFVFCTHCGQKMRVPAGKNLLITCPKCRHSFTYST